MNNIPPPPYPVGLLQPTQGPGVWICSTMQKWPATRIHLFFEAWATPQQQRSHSLAGLKPPSAGLQHNTGETFYKRREQTVWCWPGVVPWEGVDTRIFALPLGAAEVILFSQVFGGSESLPAEQAGITMSAFDDYFSTNTPPQTAQKTIPTTSVVTSCEKEFQNTTPCENENFTVTTKNGRKYLNSTTIGIAPEKIEPVVKEIIYMTTRYQKSLQKLKKEYNHVLLDLFSSSILTYHPSAGDIYCFTIMAVFTCAGVWVLLLRDGAGADMSSRVTLMKRAFKHAKR